MCKDAPILQAEFLDVKNKEQNTKNG